MERKNRWFNRGGYTRRIVALTMAFLLVLTLVLPGRGSDPQVYAAYVNPQLVELAANNIEVELSNPGGALDRDSTFGIKINYTIPKEKLDEARVEDEHRHIIWVYDLEDFIDNNPLLDLAQDQSGNITQGATIRGSYTISGNKVYLDVSTDWLNEVTSDVSGTFALNMSLDAEKVGSKNDLSFRFPGTNTDFSFSFGTPATSNNSKNAVDGNGNQAYGSVKVTPNSDGTYDVNYQVKVTPNSYHESSFNVIDKLTSENQSFDVSSFKVNYMDKNDNYAQKEINLSSFTSLSGDQKTATVDLFGALAANNGTVAKGTEYTISYTTKVTADAIGEELTNTVQTTWENGGSTPETPATITPVSAVSVDKVYQDLGSDNQYQYTITIGDGTMDLSGLTITDQMKDLQYLVGDITLNGNVIPAANTTFTDNTFSDNTTTLFTYTTPANYGSGPITITYTVQLPNSEQAPAVSGNKDITNHVGVTGEGREGSDDTNFQHTFGTAGEGTVVKSFESFDETNNKIQWRIVVANTGTTALSGAYISDTPSVATSANPYYSDPTLAVVDWSSVVVKDATDKSLTAGTDYTVDSTNKKIQFTSIPALTTYYVYLSTAPTAGVLADGDTYKNDTTLYNGFGSELATGSDQKKYSSNRITVSKDGAYDEATDTYTWTAVVNPGKSGLDPDRKLYFSDTLPEGMEFVPGSMNFKFFGISTLDTQEYWENNVVSVSDEDIPISGQTMGPVDVSAAFDRSETYRTHTIGISGLKTTVTYKTRMTTAEKEAVKGATETHTYTNTFKVTDDTGTPSYGEDDSTVSYTYKFLTKTDLSPELIDNVDKDIINFQIDVNKDELTLNEGDPLTLEDTLATNIELITSGFNGKYGFTVEDKNGKDLIASGDSTVSYNDDSRKITVTIPDRTYAIVKYSVRTRQTGNITVDNQAILIGGGKQYSDSTSENHNVSSHSATIQGGGIQLHKIDEHNISKELPGAVFKLYEVPFDATTYELGTPQLVTDDITSTDGYYTIKAQYLEEGKFYYWQETTPPTGYELDDTPHNFVVYRSDIDGSYNAAKLIDNGVQTKNPGMKVNTVELNNYVWTVCNRKGVETTSFKIKKILDTSAISGQAVEADVLAQEFPITFTLTAAAGKTLPTSVDVEVTHADASKTTSSVALTAGVGTVTLKAGETAEIKGLPLGTTYKVTETADAALTAAGFTYDATAVGAGYTGDVENDGTTKVEVTNGYTLPIQLEITKTVVSALTTDKKDKEFTFTVTLNNDAINGTYGDLTFTNGVATVSLKDGEKAEVGGLPAGTGYLVVESEDDTFTTTAENTIGAITTTKTTVPFTNTRKGSFKISKAVTGNGKAITNTELKNKMAGTYTFTVYTDEDCTVPYQQTAGENLTVTVTVPNTGATATSAEVTNVLPGEYWIKETAPTNGSSPVVNPVHITVEAGKVGTQAVVASFTNDYEFGEIHFTKDFTFPEGVSIAPSLRLNLAYELRRQGEVVKQFTYTDVYAALSTGQQYYTISNLPLADDYVLVETNPNIFLDTYNIVLDEAASTISKDAIAVTKGQATVVNLNNVYKKRTSEVVLQGVKTVNGAKISTGDALDGQFTFTLHETTTGTVSDKLTDDLTASNAASGIQFDAISYTAPGVHTYRITEAAAVNQPDVAIDPVIYDITVTVAEDPQDATSLTANVTAATKTVGETTTAIDYNNGQNIVFDNTLEEKTSFKIAKTLTTTSTSATVLGQAFPISFVLTAPAGKTLPDAVDVTITHANTSKTNISVALSGGAGSVTLKRGEMAEIKDLPQGTTYKVTETADASLEAKGFTYDATAVSTDGYAGTVADDGSTVVSVVNGYTMPVVSLVVSKIWDDGNDAAGLRPESIDVNLKAGTAVSDTAKLEAGNQWHKRWSDLPKYDSDLQEIVYSVEEDAASVTGLNVHYDLGAPTETAASGEDAKIYTITNTLKTGDLKVSKKVVSDLSADSDEEFNFTVTLTGSNLTGTYGGMNFTDGVAVVTLKKGQSVTATGLPAGVAYTVTETPNNKFTTGKTGDTGTISETEMKEAEFTNTRLVGSLEVKKEVVSSTAGDKQTGFTFTVTLGDTTINGATGAAGAYGVEFLNGVATFTLKDGESKTIQNLPVDVDYTVEETAVNGFATTKTGDTGTINTERSTAEFKNTRAEGNLIVGKEVASPLEADKNIKFDFTVTLDDNTINGTYGDLTFTNGVAETQLASGETATAEGLRKGIGYTVEETANELFTTTTSGATGTIGDDPSIAVFTNTRKTGKLTVSKTLVSDLAADAAKDFEFTVTLDDTTVNGIFGDMLFTDGVATVTLKGGESAVATGLPTGISYTVTEAEDAVNFTTQPSGDTGTIDVSAAGKTAAFTNTRKTGDLKVSKTLVSDRAADADKEFEFVVTLSDNTISGTYGEMTFTNGVATFTLKGGQDVTAAGLPFTVGYTVTEADAAGFTTTKTYDAGSVPANAEASAVFTNTRKTGTLEVSKTVVSSTASDLQKDFSFTVTLSDTTINGTTGATGAYGVEFTDGVATFTLKDGESKTIQNLPTEITYTVTEEAADGFITTKTGDTGTISETKSEAKFTNKKDEGGLIISKSVVSPLAADHNLKFAFTVTLSDDTINGTYDGLTFNNGVAEIKLADGETATATGLPKGITYEVVETANNLFTTTKTGDSGTIGDTASSAEFTNTRKTGKLTVSKTLVSDLAADATKDFEFTVTLGDNTITGTYGDMAFTDGVATFTLKGGESKAAEGLPAGISYTVAETEDADNFTTDKTNATGTIDSESDMEAGFTNTRKTGDLKVSKTLVSDRAADADQEFTFTVALTDTTISGTYGDMTFAGGVATITLKGGEDKTAEGLPATVGYTVTEAAATGFITTKTGDVGSVSATSTMEAEFTNTRKTGSLKVSKTVVSSTASDKQTAFTFTVTLGDNTINGTTGAAGDYGVAFLNGVATFTLKDGESKTIQNLPTEITYTVTETAADGFITTKTGDTGTISETQSEAEFTNTKDEGGLIVSKSVDSSLAADHNLKFAFTVTLDDDTINGTYGELTFTDGVAEVELADGETATANGLPKGINYTVTETANNLFTTTKTGDSGTIGDTASSAEFTNTRKTGKLTVSKTLVSDLAADASKDFSFTVTLGDNTITGTYGDMAFTDGVATFTLKGGETAVATGLPTGIDYEVVETEDTDFTTQKTGDTGTIDVSAAGCTAAFTNTRKTGDLKVSKVLVSDRAADADQEFNFTVTLSDTTISGTYGDMTFENGVASIALKGGQTVTAAGLPSTVEYTVAETADSNFTTTKTDETGNVPANATASAVFTNTRKTGSLEVSKSVVSSDASDKQKEFTFTVTLSDTTINGTAGIAGDLYGVEFVNGVATFTLKDSESKTIQNLPTEITYTVTEEAADGFITTKTGDTGTISGTKSEAKFTNTREEGGLVISKTVVSPLPADSDESFDFTVTLGDDTVNGTYGGLTFINGVAEVSLKHGETASATGLPKNTTFAVSEDTPDRYTAAWTNQTGTIGDDTVTVTCTNTRNTGSLKVTKAVVSKVAADADTSFTFIVTLDNNTVNGTFSGVVFTNGSGTFTLKKGESKVIEGLPTGVGYTVTEGAAANTNFTCVASGNTGTIGDVQAEAVFTNTRKPGQLTVSKTVVSPETSDGDTKFTFTITLDDQTISGLYGDLIFSQGVATVQMKGGESATATGLPSGTGYKVTETAVTGFDISYADAEGTIMNDAAASAVVTNTRQVGRMTISKTFAIPNGVNVSETDKEALTFQIKRGDTVYHTFTYADFTSGSYETPDLPTYDDYTVVETNADSILATYYLVLDETDSKIQEANVAVTKNQKTPVALRNSYKKAQGTIALKAYKTLDDQAIAAGSTFDGQFNFRLEETTNGDVPDKLTQAMNKTNAGSEVAFDAITYTVPAVHEYTITETVPVALPNIASDATEYVVEVTVTQDVSDPAKMNAVVTGVTKNDGTTTTHPAYNAGQGVAFNNIEIVEASPVSMTAGLTKLYKDMYNADKAMTEGQFGFTLTSIPYNGVTDSVQGRAERTAENKKNGSVDFGTFTYTSADAGKTYAYLIAETDPAADTAALDMDETKYILTVEVVETQPNPGKYQLHLNKQWYLAPTGTVADIVDGNKKAEADVKLVNRDRSGILKITKTIKGDITPEEAAGQLQFTVTDENGNVLVVKDGSREKRLENLILEKDFTKVGDIYELEVRVPAGQKYVVSEVIYDVDGAVLESVKANGQVLEKEDGIYSVITESVQPDDTTVAAYEDNYKKGSIVITKTIKGDVTPEEAAGQLEFTIVNETTGETKVVNLSEFTFDETTKTYSYEMEARPGDVYTITETDYDVDGMILESVSHKVNAGESEDGASVTGVVVQLTGQTRVDFEDDYRKDQGVIKFTKYAYVSELCSATPKKTAPLAGVVFQAVDVTNKKNVYEATSDKNGQVKFETMPAGTYEIREVEVPDNIVKSNAVYLAVIENESFTGLTKKDGTPVEKNRIINDQVRADITFTKVSEQADSTVLAGSLYGLFRVLDDGTEEKIAEKVTDKDGVVVFRGVLPDTKYLVRELESPDGYYVSKYPLIIGFKVAVGADGSKMAVTDVDVLDTGDDTVIFDENGNMTWLEPEILLQVKKLDPDGKNLAGAKLQIEDMDGNVVVPAWTTTGEISEISGKLVVGKEYRLVEVEAPEGYEIAGPVTFTVKNEKVGPGEDKVITITMIDEKEKEEVPPSPPKTNDDSPILPVAGLMALSLAGITVVSSKKRKDKRNK